MGTMQCPLSLCSLPLSLGLSATLGPLFCSQLLCGMPETENLVPGAAPCPPPAVWGQWPNTARCPPGATCLLAGCGFSPTLLFSHTHSPTSLHKRIDKESVVHLHNEVLLSYLKNDAFNSSIKCPEGRDRRIQSEFQDSQCCYTEKSCLGGRGSRHHELN